MDPLTIGGIIAAGSALVSSLGNMWSTHRINNKQEELMNQQNAFNERMVEKQNEYNSPANQARLMSEAGFNPAFLFGSGGIDATQPTAAQGAALPNLTAPQFDGNSIAQSLFDAKRLQNETMKNEADIGETIQRSESYRLANSTYQERFDAEMSKLRNDSSLSEADRNLRIQQLETEKARMQEVFYNAENLKYNTQLIQQKAISEKWSQKKIEAEYTRLVKLTPIEAKELMSRYDVNEAQASNLAIASNKIQQEIVNLIKSGSLIDAQKVSVIMDNAIKDMRYENEAEREDEKKSNRAWNVLTGETNSILGDLIKGLGSIFSPWSMQRNYQHSRPGTDRYNKTKSSWLFD